MFAWATACQPTAIGAVSAARGAHERRDEVLVRFPEGAELGNTQVFLVEAPACVLALAFWCRGVGVSLPTSCVGETMRGSMFGNRCF
jgi:hypothetical protein